MASAGADGPYLVPLTLVWTGDRILLAVDAASRTARNITAGGRVRLGIGPTRDVVLIDAVLERAPRLAEAPDLAEQYAARSDWDPRQAAEDYRLLVLRPVRIQAWREANEVAGRTLMRDGRWLV